jgi:hypothetical protein
LAWVFVSPHFDLQTWPAWTNRAGHEAFRAGHENARAGRENCRTGRFGRFGHEFAHNARIDTNLMQQPKPGGLAKVATSPADAHRTLFGRSFRSKRCTGRSGRSGRSFSNIFAGDTFPPAEERTRSLRFKAGMSNQAQFKGARSRRRFGSGSEPAQTQLLSPFPSLAGRFGRFVGRFRCSKR